MWWFKKSKFNGREYREETSRKISWGHWFAFFNIIIAILIGSRYAFLIDWPDTLLGKIYFFISLLGHFSFCVFALYLLVIFPLSFIIKNHRTFRGLTVIIATICTTLLLFDTEVFNRFNIHLSSIVWNLLVNPEKGDLSRDWQIFFAPMPIILLIQMLFSRWSWEKLRSLERQKWLKKVGLVLISTFVATHLIYAWADAFLYSQRLEQEGRLDALKLDYPKKDLLFEQVENKPNILVITVSGLRYDALTSEKMPKLFEFATSSTQFTNHYSSGNTNNAGLVGLFYGLNANYTDSILSNHTPSVLITKLQDEKYQFVAYSSTAFKDSLFKQALFRNVKLPKVNASSPKDARNGVLSLLKEDKPWFAYVDLDIADQTEENYTKSLADIDQQIDETLASVSLENTIVIITAEHGTTFNKLDEKEQENYFGRDEIQVPFIVYWKDLPVQEVSKLTSHTDLLPALMSSIFKVKNPVSDYAQGRNLFELNGDPWVLASNFRWNVIIQPDGTQYHIDRKGNYKKFDRTYTEQSSSRPPLGLFLEVFKQERSFVNK